MKQFLFILCIVVSTYGYAQSNTITGTLTDAELGNDPLFLATVTLKETGAKVMTDADGKFTFNALKPGIYTVVYSFTGYDTKKVKVDVTTVTTKQVKTSLSASSLNLDDLAMVFATSEKQDNSLK